jgi:hypothetical protein
MPARPAPTAASAAEMLRALVLSEESNWWCDLPLPMPLIGPLS